MTSTKSGNRNWRLAMRGGVVAALMALGAGAADAQTGQIRGTVREAGSGAPLDQVQIYLVDANLGSISRQNGTYVMVNIPAGIYQIRAERIGMTTVTQSITLAAGATLDHNFELAPAALGLDELVITGSAGAARRREVGNSVTQINTVDLPERPTSVLDMIQSMAPSVSVTAVGGGGEIGNGSNIEIRGINSINNNSSPIIFIDGIRIMSNNFSSTSTPDIHSNGSNTRPSPLDQLNPADIERIEIISGPAASTLYGTEASAGVIQVFTRQGTNRAPVWTAEVQGSTLWNRPFGANGSDYLGLEHWLCDAPFSCGQFMEVPISQSYALSTRGGAQALQYFVSFGHDREKGNTINDHLERWNVRGNFTLNPMEDVLFQWTTAYSNANQQNTSSGNNAGGLALNVYRGTQGYFGTDSIEVLNQIMDWDISQTIERFTSGGTFTYTPLANLSNRLTVGYDFSQQESRNLRPFGFRLFPQGGLDIQVYSRRLLSFDYVGTYSFNILEGLGSSFSWGGQSTGDFSARVSAFGEGFPGAAKPTVNSSSSTLGFETRETTWNSGFFFQNVFNLNEKYFLTTGVRADGNSTFGKGFGLAIYPKASASWVVSDESFWRQQFGELKLRAAWGRSGRAPGTFVATRTWTNGGLAGQPAFIPGNLGNPDIGPEVTSEIEVGFDASWFSDRVRPRFTYYYQRTEDAIQSLSSIPSLGFTSSVNFNLGTVDNWGKEIAVDLTALRTRNWGLDLGATYSTNGNEVVTWLGVSDPALDNRIGRPLSGTTSRTMWANGEAMGTSLHSASMTYNTQSCLVDLVDADGEDVLDADGENVQVPRTGLDPSIHSCSFSSQLIYGSDVFGRPSTIAGMNMTVRVPYGISVSARGDYRGGGFKGGYSRSTQATGGAIGRNVRVAQCLPYYQDLESNQLRTDTPGIWVQRCRSTNAYSHNGDIWELRSLSAAIPMDFAFPDRVQSAALTLVMNNVLTVLPGSLFGNYASSGERIPPATTIRASLRVTF